MSTLPDPAIWTPVRYVNQDETCARCGRAIPKASPGSTTGSRGTKAFLNMALNEWECWPDRQEATRAEIALQVEKDRDETARRLIMEDIDAVLEDVFTDRAPGDPAAEKYRAMRDRAKALVRASVMKSPATEWLAALTALRDDLTAESLARAAQRQEDNRGAA